MLIKTLYLCCQLFLSLVQVRKNISFMIRNTPNMLFPVLLFRIVYVLSAGRAFVDEQTNYTYTHTLPSIAGFDWPTERRFVIMTVARSGWLLRFSCCWSAHKRMGDQRKRKLCVFFRWLCYCFFFLFILLKLNVGFGF